MSNEFDPKKIIDFSQDYYEILDIAREAFPKGNTRNDKIFISDLIDKAFRKQARKKHPDFGGTNEEFLNLVRARRILEDSLLRNIYDKGEFTEDSNLDAENPFIVDWNKVGTYRKGTPEDSIGFSLFFTVAEMKDKLNLVPAFYPQTSEHNYEWDFLIKDTKSKLVLSIVNDENEVLRLTDSKQIEESLPFKIYICIPRTNLFLRRNTSNQVVSPDGNKVMINGELTSVSYSDYNLLETTSLETAKNYLKTQLENDLQDLHNGKLTKNLSKIENDNKQSKWMSGDEMKQFDKEKLQMILNLRSHNTKFDEKAADFIDKLPEN
jgi:curved DNA-binding protein CbpA